VTTWEWREAWKGRCPRCGGDLESLVDLGRFCRPCCLTVQAASVLMTLLPDKETQ
jgi:hypothetical protein